MICPYNHKAVKYVKQYNNDLVNEEVGVIKGYQEVLVEEYTFLECPKEGCAVWHNDRCTYNQGQIST